MIDNLGERAVCIVERVSKSFGDFPVVIDIDLRVGASEIVSLIGPSGCGKTTLLRMIGGLDRPTSGSIRLATNGSRVTVRQVFQEPRLLPWQNVRENVSLGLNNTAASSSERDARIGHALRQVGLTPFADWCPKDLSCGMLQRASIARALVARPTMLLMDEPLSALDELTRDLLLADLVKLWTQTPFTGLYVTHSPSEAVRIAHRVVLLTARPARIREIVLIDVPLDRRSEFHPTVVAARERIWQLVRRPD